MAVSGLICRKALFALAGPFLRVVFKPRNKPSHLAEPPFPVFKAHFNYAWLPWHCPRDLVYSSVCLGYPWEYTVSSPKTLGEQNLKL